MTKSNTKTRLISAITALAVILTVSGAWHIAPLSASAASDEINIGTLTEGAEGTGWSYTSNTLTITGDVTITGTKTGAPRLVIIISPGITVTWDATYTGSVSDAEALIILDETGTFHMTGGTVQNTTTKYAIYNDYGAVNISGGTVENTASGHAIYNGSNGTVNISGSGAVRANGGYAIYNLYSSSKINISGGVVSNKTTEAAIRGDSGSIINVSGGLVFSYGTALSDVISGYYLSSINITDGTVVAWNQAAGKTNYAFGTADDLAFFPADGTPNEATWHISGGDYGLLYDTNKFFKVDGVTVECDAHTPVSDWDGGAAATCTAASTRTKSCSKCSQIAESETQGALGHEASAAAATCDTAQTCIRCTYVFAAALGHSWSANNDGTHRCTRSGCTASETCSPNAAGATCSKCGYVTPAGATPPTYSLTVTAGTGGSVSGTASGSYEAGHSVSVTAIPDSSYQFNNWTVTGATITGGNTANPATFSMPADTVTLTAYFELITATVTGVTVTPNMITLNKGGSLTFSAAVSGTNAPQGVTWSVTGGNAGTSINASGRLTIAADETATTLTVRATSTHTTSVFGTAMVTVTQDPPPSDPPPTEPPPTEPPPTEPPPPTPSEEAIEDIKNAEDGGTVTITLPDGDTTLTKEVFEEIAGRDITVEIEVGGITWIIDGKDVPKDGLQGIDLGVKIAGDNIPVEVINLITGETTAVQISLNHEGPFGFEVKLKIPLEKDNAGYYANLYFYNPVTEKMEFRNAAIIDIDGNAVLTFTGASDYAIVIDDKDHGAGKDEPSATGGSKPKPPPPPKPFTSTKTDPVEKYVDVLYMGLLARSPDAGGFAYWTGQMKQGNLTTAEVAYHITFSEELKRHSLINVQFLTRLYNGILGRDPDAGGLDFWAALLGHGVTREAVFSAFITSPEFAARCKALGLVV